MYDFTAKEESDLTLKQVDRGESINSRSASCMTFTFLLFLKGEEYVILHKQDQLWWRAQDKHGYVETIQRSPQKSNTDLVFTNPALPDKFMHQQLQFSQDINLNFACLQEVVSIFSLNLRFECSNAVFMAKLTS